MQDKRDKYIDQLLAYLKTLEKKVLSVRSSDALPFSFFSESFDKTEKIARLLHEMQLMQIDDMKQQMERLVMFLSASETGSQHGAVKEEHALSVPSGAEEPHEDPAVTEADGERAAKASPFTEPTPAETEDEPPALHERNSFTAGINLPEYKNPRDADHVPSPVKPKLPTPETEREENPVFTTLNDTIKAPPAVLDLKRGISLNDRFLFQRELFNNDRHEMNNVMIKLNAFENYMSAEEYLRNSTSWHFEDPVVKNFLQAIKRGFE